MSELGVSSASGLRHDYMNLLITQLQNQNPMAPMDNNQMASQLAQLSQLEQLETMNGTLTGQSDKFDQLLQAEQAGQAAALIGKEVSFFPEGSMNPAGGIVDHVRVVDGEASLVLTQVVQLVDGQAQSLDGPYLVDMNAVQAIRSHN